MHTVHFAIYYYNDCDIPCQYLEYDFTRTIIIFGKGENYF